MRAVSFSELDWATAPMPDSSGDVSLARLPQLGDGGFRAFVRFPPGWRRAVAGSYPAAEEILILEGDLAMNGATWREGAHVWAPADALREDSASAAGCLAFAWFAGRPRWRRGAVVAAAAIAGLAHWREVDRRLGPFGPDSRLLRPDPPHESWLIQGGWEGEAAGTTESLSLADRSWRAAQLGERVAVAGPAFLRILR